MMIYVILGGGVLILALLDIFTNLRSRYGRLFRVLWGVSVAMFIGVAGLRACGVDTLTYKLMHRMIRDGIYIIDPGYMLLNKLLASFGAVLVAMAFLSVLPKSYIFRKISPYPFMSLFLFLSPWFFTQDMGQYRQAVATGFTLLSTLFICRGQRWRAFFMIAFAATFHFSALFFLPALWIPRRAFSPVRTIVVVVVAMIVGVVGIRLLPMVAGWLPPFLAAKVEQYAATAGESFFNISTLVKIALWLLAYTQRRELEKYPNGGYYLNLYFISFCMLFAFSAIPVLSGRAGLSYKIVELLLFPYMIHSFRLWGNKLWVTLFVLAVFLYGMTGYLTAWMPQYLPYRSWLAG